jgi:chitodextrinase
MVMSRRSLNVWRALGVALLLPGLIGTGTVAAGPPDTTDKTAPTAPGNLRVTGVTSYAISLAWDASKDNVGVVGYRACCWNTNSQSIAAPATSMTYTAGVESGRSATLRLYAIDAAGNYSKASNDVSVTTPRDFAPPSKPTVTVTDVGATHVSLDWSSVDDGPNIWYQVERDGLTLIGADKRTSATFGILEPETTYTFVVRARDWGGNVSPPSDPVAVTTEARDPTDVTPPTTPGNFRATFAASDGETWLAWEASTDDRTPQHVIEYRIFVNGVLDNRGAGGTWDIVYGPPLSFNTYSIVAVDASANQSAPATIVVDNS